LAASLLRRTLTGLALVVLGVIAALWIALTVWYWLGSRDLGEFEPSAATYPEEARLALWRAEGGTGAPAFPRYSATGYAWNVLHRLDVEDRAGPGQRILQQLAVSRGLRDGRWHQNLRKEFAAVVRASRWTSTQILDSLLDAMYFGGDARGLRAGANRLFGQDPDTLSRAELDLLMVVARAPGYLDPWCHRERVRTLLGKLDPALDAEVRDEAFAALAPQPADVTCR
jgi:hypothetical protein